MKKKQMKMDILEKRYEKEKQNKTQKKKIIIFYAHYLHQKSFLKIHLYFQYFYIYFLRV